MNADDLLQHAEPVLDWALTAHSDLLSADIRCSAIEELANSKVALQKAEVESLLNSTHELVRIFALGLIEYSPDRAELLDIATTKATDNPNSAYHPEVTFLTELNNN
jgi:hypothetical protein